ncbi:MAG: helix-turn-helix domain-containing protein [Bacteroidota bacterium]
MSGWFLVYQIVLGVGAVQGLVMGFLLWQRSSPRYYANRFLAVLLGFFAYRLVAELIGTAGYGGPDYIAYHFLLEFNWLYGGLLFFYVACYLNPQRRLQRSDWVHLVPPAIEFIISNYVKTQNFFWDGTPESLSWLGRQAYMLWNHTPIQIIVFCGLILGYGWYARRLWKAGWPAEDNDAAADPAVHVRWLLRFIWIYLGFAAAMITCSLVDYLFFDIAFQPFYIYPLYIGIAALTYSFGFAGFLNRNTPVKPASKIDIDGLVDVDAKVALLQHVMDEQKLYLEADLSLNTLAAAIDVKPYVLTQLLNTSIKKTFSEYVNEFRVAEVIRLFQTPAYANYTLTAIGFEAGFNSKATFNRIFRKVTGKTPGQVRDEAASHLSN